VIRSFRCRDTHGVFEGRHSKRLHNLADVAEKKLVQLHATAKLSDLSLFPGNRLESLKGSRAGQRSIRINDQFRLVFTWRDGEAHDVEIVDYH
jgi:proteic killer suppression protein